MGTRNTMTQTSNYGATGVTATSTVDVTDDNEDRGAVYNTVVDSVRALATQKCASIFTEFNVTGDVGRRDAEIAQLKAALS